MMIKRTKRPDPLPAGEKNSGINTVLPFVKLAKDTNSDKENVSIKMRIDDTVSKDDKTNYETKSFNVIEIFGYNSAAVVEILCDLDLEIFTPYALKGPLLIRKGLGLFLRFLKGTAKTQFEEAIRDFQNQVLDEYNDK